MLTAFVARRKKEGDTNLWPLQGAFAPSTFILDFSLAALMQSTGTAERATNGAEKGEGEGDDLPKSVK